MTMKLLPTAFGLLLAATISAGGQARADMPVVVELFTSQGCSSCPPADELMGSLAARDDVVALAYHVDYWNYIGWVDPFSDPAWTARQRDYAANLGTSMIYTPQAMVQGMTDVIGSRKAELDRAIEVAKTKQAVMTVAFADAGTRLDLSAGAKQTEPVDVILVAYRRLTETIVTRGENAGRTLVGHNVVGEVQDLGEWDGSAKSLAIDLPSLQAKGFDGLAVLIQGQETGTIFAAAKLANSDEPLVSQGIENSTDPAGTGAPASGGSASPGAVADGGGASAADGDTVSLGGDETTGGDGISSEGIGNSTSQ